jgi:hypothetical protein
LKAKAAEKKPPILKQKPNKVVDFESEMDSELDKIIERETKAYSNYFGKKTVDFSKPTQSFESKKQVEEDEEDTDSEAELETGVRSTKKRAHFTNDELFYDPDMDQEDENWLNQQRATCHRLKTQRKPDSKASTSTNEETRSDIPNYSDARTDAILNCPCCMTLLCHDCQR